MQLRLNTPLYVTMLTKWCMLLKLVKMFQDLKAFEYKITETSAVLYFVRDVHFDPLYIQQN